MESGGKGACLDACIDGYFDIWCSTDFEYTGSHRLQIWNLWFLLFCRVFIFSHDVVIDRLSRYWIVFGAAAVCMGIYYTVHFFGENYAVEPVVNHMTASLYCWFAILAILAFMKKYGDRSDQLTKWMTKKSWGLYVFHYLPLAIAAYYLNRYASNLPSGLVYMLVGVSAFGGAFVLDALISRIPIIRWCVLGIKKEKKDV